MFLLEIPSGCISVLNMGASIKIDDLARQVIRLSGLTPDKDIRINYTGLKKGEKLNEKLYASEEKKINQGSEGYFLVNSKKVDKMDIGKLLKNLELLCNNEHSNLYSKLFKILG